MSDDAEAFRGRRPIKPGGVERAKRLRSALTWTEAKLWERLRGCAVRIRRQAPIGPYVVDFACLRAKLVIEVDGGIHNRTDVALRDLERDAFLASQGFAVLRIDARRIPGELDAIIREVDNLILRAIPTYRPASPLPLEGEGAGGWGVGNLLQNKAHEASSPKTLSPSEQISRHPAHTPSQPFPLEGKGSSDY